MVVHTEKEMKEQERKVAMKIQSAPAQSLDEA